MREQRANYACWLIGWATAAYWHWAAAGTIAAIWPVPGAVWWRPSSPPETSVFGYNPAPFPLIPSFTTKGSCLMFSNRLLIKDVDPELQRALDGERQRQEDHIELIASENYASPRVMEAQGSSLTNKYAEGYPGKRYYGGCEFVDIAEQLAIDRAKKLFGADYANVQPHSGSQANAAVYLALLSPGDVILGMSLDQGGHLTHGAKVNFSGKLFHAFQYGVHPDSGLINYEQIEALALEHKPKMIVAGFSAYSRVIDWARLRTIADQVGALLFVDMAHVAGLVAAGEYPNPLPYADVVTTTTHKTLRGPRGGMILARANDALTKKINSMVFPGTQGGPLMHVIAAKAVALLEALQPDFKQYQRQVVANARAMCAVLASRGYGIVSGGTDNHLLLLSLVGRDITGKDADAALGRANITVNKNAVPNDPRPPMISSGLRLGTPAATTRGFREPEIRKVAGWIADILDAGGADSAIERVRPQAIELCRRFPVYAA
jgi:glycine hydroxymethyltransferase